MRVSDEPLMEQQRLSNKRMLLLLFIAFALPGFASWYIYSHRNDISFSLNSKGELLRPHKVVELNNIYDLRHNIQVPNLKNTWSVVHISYPSEEKAYLLNNLHVALGKDQERVDIYTAQSNEFLPGSIIILDRSNLAIFKYEENAGLHDILKDFKKLLKFNR